MKTRLIPLRIKLAYTAFMAVLIPVYLYHYGPTNFLYFCDVALLLTLAAVWLDSPLLSSAALVGIFMPQMLWVADFFAELSGQLHTGLTAYMFDQNKPFYLRFLSFFHFWLPFLLMLIVYYVGYDWRGLILWTVIAWILMLVCYLCMPPPGYSDDPNLPVNINYVYGFSDKKEQTLMDPNWYFATVVLILTFVVYPLTHLIFWTTMPRVRHLENLGNTMNN